MPDGVEGDECVRAGAIFVSGIAAHSPTLVAMQPETRRCEASEPNLGVRPQHTFASDAARLQQPITARRKGPQWATTPRAALVSRTGLLRLCPIRAAFHAGCGVSRGSTSRRAAGGRPPLPAHDRLSPVARTSPAKAAPALAGAKPPGRGASDGGRGALRWRAMSKQASTASRSELV